MKKKLILLLGLIALLISLERINYLQNRGFRLSKLISPQPAVDIPPEENVDALLDQSFRFFGAGKTSFVFLGEDGKTILKLFKHQHLFFNEDFFRFVLPGTTEFWRIGQILFRARKERRMRHPYFFTSCDLAMKELKEETGLIYFTAQPNRYFDREVKLIDSWGIPNHINLSKTEFALQKKAEPLFSYLDKLLKEGRHEEARQAIDSVVELILTRCSKGIGDSDPNLRINFGYVDGKAVEIDLGSFEPDLSLQSPLMASRELFFVTSGLRRWLQDRSPELADYLLIPRP